MPDRNEPGRQPGWRILVAATAVTLSGGVSVVSAADATPSRVTLDDVLPMREISAPAPIVVPGALEVVSYDDRYDTVAGGGSALAAEVIATAELTPTPNTVDPTPNTPDPTPNTPDPTPNTPDPTPDSPDPTPNTPDSPDDASSPD